jgi:hypothetical protein
LLCRPGNLFNRQISEINQSGWIGRRRNDDRFAPALSVRRVGALITKPPPALAKPSHNSLSWLRPATDPVALAGGRKIGQGQSSVKRSGLPKLFQVVVEKPVLLDSGADSINRHILCPMTPSLAAPMLCPIVGISRRLPAGQSESRLE